MYRRNFSPPLKCFVFFFRFWEIYSPRGHCFHLYAELQEFESLCKLYRCFASLYLISIKTLSGFQRLVLVLSDIYGIILKNDMLSRVA